MQSQSCQLSACRASLEQLRLLGIMDIEIAALETGLLAQAGDAKQYFEKLQGLLQAGGQNNSRVASSVLMTSLYQDELTAEAVAQLHRTVMVDVSCAPTSAGVLPGKSLRSGPTLRIGYVTGDLHRQHPVNIFMLPLLQRQKLSNLEILVVFARRSAPVQASFLGCPHSTGLRAMDYLIGDHIVSPPEHEHFFSEKVMRLNGPVFCWASIDDYPLPLESTRCGPGSCTPFPALFCC